METDSLCCGQLWMMGALREGLGWDWGMMQTGCEGNSRCREVARWPAVQRWRKRGEGKRGKVRDGEHSHKVALEELLQFPLGCRIGQVADVQTTALSGAGEDGIVVGGGRLGIGGLVVDRGVAQRVGDVVDSVGDLLGNLLHGGRHVDGFGLGCLVER